MKVLSYKIKLLLSDNYSGELYMKTRSTYSGLSDLTQIMSFIEDKLDNAKIEKKARTKTLLLAEEAYVALCRVLDEGEKISLYTNKKPGKVSFVMKAKGNAISQDIGAVTKFSAEDIDADETSEAAIRKLILNANADALKISYKSGINSVSISAGKDGSKQIQNMLWAILCAVVFGFIMRVIPADIANGINDLFLYPTRTVILNLLQMVIAPMVFFSIASSVAQFSDFKLLGKTGAKVIAFYMFTTCVAVFVSISMFYLIQPGQWGVLLADNTAVTEIETSGISFVDTVIGIAPDNFVKAFAENNTLQIIVIAVLFGIAASMVGSSAEKIQAFFNCGTELILKAVQIIIKVIPLMLFASFSSLVFTADTGVILSLISIFIALIFADLLMIVCYNVLVVLITKKNPIWFMKNAFPAWLNAFGLMSSNASMSFTMETCRKKLKVSQKICSFSIPLGATINMDGYTLLLMISGLFFAKCYGIPMGLSDVIALAITAIILSVSAPGVPGAALMCASVIFAQLGVPAEALSLYVAIETIFDPFDTADNVLGDIVGTFCIATRTGMIEADKPQ